MSAIFGILGFNNTPVERRSAEGMARALSHRAPDSDGLWTGDAIAIGHGLMRVTHEDRFDQQPMAEEDFILSADLRLDNREALAAMLAIDDERLATMADSALLLEAYRAWGESCVQRLLGDFAFAIWDRKRRRLLLARDHLGQRNCFFHRGADRFLFASEIKALWTDADVPRRMSEAAIARRLLHDRSPDAGSTAYDGIECLAGGELLLVEADGSSRRETYWRPAADPAHLGRDEAYYVQAYRDVLGEAVACRVRRAAAPVSLMMSGGYDSAAVAALAGAPLEGRRLAAVASAMPEAYAGSIRHARRWVDLCAKHMPHLDVSYVTFESAGLLDGLERRFLQAGAEAHTYGLAAERLYAAAAARGARVILTGYGGELTLNPRGGGLLAQLLAEGRWRAFLRELRAHVRVTGRPLWTALRQEVVAKLWPQAARLWRRLKSGADAPPWRDQPINPDFATRMIAAGALQADELRTHRSRRKFLDRRMRALGRKAQRAAQTELAYAAGLEQSEPFYDKRVVELALAIPTELQLRNGRERDLACRALADLYPPEYQTRSRLNDDMLPDFLRMAKAAEPHLLAELARMEAAGRLGAYVDFDQIRRLLAARGPDDHASGWEEETQVALDAYVTARHIEWFRGYN